VDITLLDSNYITCSDRMCCKTFSPTRFNSSFSVFLYQWYAPDHKLSVENCTFLHGAIISHP